MERVKRVFVGRDRYIGVEVGVCYRVRVDWYGETGCGC